MIDAPIVPLLAEYYDIDWILVYTHKTDLTAEGAVGTNQCRPREYDLRFRQRDPRVIGRYLSLLNDILGGGYDLVYTSFHGLPYFLPIVALRLDLGKVIYAVHNVTTPKGAVNERAMRIYHAFVFSRFQRFHVFSEYQLRAIEALLPDKSNHYAPFPLLDYGPSHVTPKRDTIRFLFFGYIRRYKRLDLLIKAFRNLRNAGFSNIELAITGDCDEWDEYQQLIGDESGIQTRIEVVRSSDVSDVVAACHYVVLPYQDTAQSGVLTLAYQYGKPVIASDIPGFRDCIEEGTTGFFFESESERSLTEVMRDAITRHRERYPRLKQNIEEYVRREYSLEAVVDKYRLFLDDAVGAV
jgi:glycosyltransferase involved in cell wall biosynthesis